jgi:hypothetical protein
MGDVEHELRMLAASAVAAAVRIRNKHSKRLEIGRHLGRPTIELAPEGAEKLAEELSSSTDWLQWIRSLWHR